MPRSPLGLVAMLATLACTLCVPVPAGAQSSASPEARNDRGRAGTGVAGTRTNAQHSSARRVAADVLHRGEQVSRQIASLLDGARRGRALPQIHCLNDTLSQTNSTLRMARLRSARLMMALRVEHRGQQGHEVAVLMSLHERFSELDRAARVCVGDVGAPVDRRTTVVMTVDPRVPDEDPTVLQRRGRSTLFP